MLKLQTTTSLSPGHFHGFNNATQTLTSPPPASTQATNHHLTQPETNHHCPMDSEPTHLQITNNSVTAVKLSPEDEFLSNSTHLSRQQVLQRRSHNMQQLSKCYRDHYWGLMEEVRVRYREYMWKFGISPFQEDRNEDEKDNVKQEQVRDGIDEGSGDVDNGKSLPCVFNGCMMKAMTLTRFCHKHILSDPKQQLYKPCEFFLKSAHAGFVPCGKPVLRSIVPSLCSIHFLKAQQHVVRALRKAGLNITCMDKFVPKFHVIVTEYVREIQEKRKKNGSMAIAIANKKKVVPKLEIEN
ncbi:hypothetical protein QVD17_11213 [Tagetes erecta]|uniref:KANL2-like probable zinc-finger domain-containing protein n=1 Tax=Tagetes erecta TaxID=13708 RepID=A0AAD8KT16_TARER|nr:hypothetical protein QVD17_11213 [Tagetes erecta]